MLSVHKENIYITIIIQGVAKVSGSETKKETLKILSNEEKCSTAIIGDSMIKASTVHNCGPQV